MHQAATGTHEVSSNVGDVTEGASATGANATRVLDAASRLSQEAGSLRQKVERFFEGHPRRVRREGASRHTGQRPAPYGQNEKAPVA